MTAIGAIPYLKSYDDILNSLKSFEERMKKLNAFGEQMRRTNAFGEQMKSLRERSERIQGMFGTQQHLGIAQKLSFGLEDTLSNLTKSYVNDPILETNKWYTDYVQHISLNRLNFGIPDSTANPLYNYIKTTDESNREFLAKWSDSEETVNVSNLSVIAPRSSSMSIRYEWNSYGPIAKTMVIISLLGFIAGMLGITIHDVIEIITAPAASERPVQLDEVRARRGAMCIDTTLD